MRRIGVFLTVLLVSIALGAGAVAGCVLLLVPAASPLVHLSTAGHPPPLTLAPLSQRSEILDVNGNVMAQLYSNEDRDPITLDQVPSQVINAVLDTEDRNFYKHSGVDVKGILRAFVRDVKAGNLSQGGSTITQQLVKNTLFVGGRKRTAHDKIREATLAIRLEHDYSKDDILGRYLNTVYFGRDAYGLKAAAERWFNSSVQALTVPQAALLAGMIENPGGDDPILHPQAAHDRRLQVLRNMADSGHITPLEVDEYSSAPLPKRTWQRADFAPRSYFVDAMEKWLEEDNPAGKALANTATTRRYRIYHGGLQITTTYDPALQAAADQAARTNSRLNAAETIPLDAAHPGGPVQMGMVAIDNATGAVRAMEGGAGFSTSQYNLATIGKFQPGSSFKTFTLATALEAGYSPTDTVNGSANCSFPYPLATTATNKPYDIHADGSGLMTLRDAIANSINCAFARVIISLGAGSVGPSRVVEMAHRLGVRSSTTLSKVTSITLGTSPVAPIDMAAAYSTLANGGVRRDPIYVTKIVAPDGTVLFDQPASPGAPVLSAQVANTVTDMLKGVIQFGTASPGGNIGRPAAGKTGTTDKNVAVWFVGYTPQLTVAVAIGKPACQNPDNPACSLNQDLGGSGQVFGGTVAAPIWAAFMRAALANQPPLDFPPPDPSAWASSRYIDEFGRQTYAQSTTTTTVPTTVPTATTTTTVPKSPKTTTATTVPHTPTTIAH